MTKALLLVFSASCVSHRKLR